MLKAIALPVAFFMFLLACESTSHAQNSAPPAAPGMVPIMQVGIMPSATPSAPQVTYQLPTPPPPYVPTGVATGPVPGQAKLWTPPDTADLSQRLNKETAQRRQAFEAAMNSWIGSDINDLIMKWGAPSGVYKMPNQNVVYTWQNTGGMSAPDGGEIVTFCKLSVFTDPRGRIFNWQAQGNDCL